MTATSKPNKTKTKTDVYTEYGEACLKILEEYHDQMGPHNETRAAQLAAARAEFERVSKVTWDRWNGVEAVVASVKRAKLEAAREERDRQLTEIEAGAAPK